MVAEVRQSVPTFARETPVSFSLAMASSTVGAKQKRRSGSVTPPLGMTERSVPGHVQGAIAMLDAGAQAKNMVTAMATTGGDIGPPPGMASAATATGEEGQESRAKRFFVGEPITPPPGCQVDELRQFMINKFEVIEQRIQHLKCSCANGAQRV